MPSNDEHKKEDFAENNKPPLIFLKNRKKYWFSARDKMQSVLWERLPDSTFEISFRKFIFGKQYLGTGNFLIYVFITSWLKPMICKFILDPFFANIEYTTSILNKSNNTKTNKIRTLKYDYQLYYKSITKQEIINNPKLIKKLTCCHSKIKDLQTGKIYRNFCDTITPKTINKNELHLCFTQQHRYFDEVAIGIMADAKKNGFNRLFCPSHSRLIANREGKEPENNGLITTDHYGVPIKTNLVGGINKKFNIPFGLLNNKSYFDGNCFTMSTGLEITQKFINEYMSFATVTNAQASIPEVEHGLHILHNVSAGLESCFYATQKSDSFLKKIYAKYYNSCYLPFCVKKASKRDQVGSTYCIDSVADILLKAMKIINNKEFIKSHKYTKQEITEMIEFLEAGKHWTFDLPMMLMQMNWNTGIFTNDVKVLIED